MPTFNASIVKSDHKWWCGSSSGGFRASIKSPVVFYGSNTTYGAGAPGQQNWRAFQSLKCQESVGRWASRWLAISWICAYIEYCNPVKDTTYGLGDVPARIFCFWRSTTPIGTNYIRYLFVLTWRQAPLPGTRKKPERAQTKMPRSGRCWDCSRDRHGWRHLDFSSTGSYHHFVSFVSRVDDTSRHTLKPVRSWLGPPPRSIINPDSRRAIIRVTMLHRELDRCEERSTYFLLAKSRTRLGRI